MLHVLTDQLEGTGVMMHVLAAELKAASACEVTTVPSNHLLKHTAGVLLHVSAGDLEALVSHRMQ